jgi:hypothetical protein
VTHPGYFGENIWWQNDRSPTYELWHDQIREQTEAELDWRDRHAPCGMPAVEPKARALETFVMELAA